MTEAEPNDKKVELRLKKLREDAEKGGYHLNPDESMVKDLVSGLVKNDERYGFESCPCRLVIGKKEKNLDIICPCYYRDEDLSDYGSCFCALYVSEDVCSEKKKVEPIPDRRLEEKEKTETEEKTKVSIKNALNLKYPVYRCKVCGYLCSRQNPPEKCPICGVGADRFEKYF
ncbi:ferredoxin-thioredoxin reductase catalytic subunit [Methanomicrobium sp. W14]|jgi:ferredoxin-thioredoxin reductase catalytic chain|uniref:ferredoxin-thioredoxin reductase catalytic domain-containing protein n=1 Tax=Methanomicrobium sp. W14 TaxID=2817839 RepID=UPI001AE4B645|nr:ferredoxin-thioredoxin reductase catalytic domain-containing protein [Methanomicrobium sp. W14]MBP2132636.1 ferredoxin-thioredoxin reductase catalytic subunit [Methanomicrobium sp. W14]